MQFLKTRKTNEMTRETKMVEKPLYYNANPFFLFTIFMIGEKLEIKALSSLR